MIKKYEKNGIFQISFNCDNCGKKLVTMKMIKKECGKYGIFQVFLTATTAEKNW